MRSEDLDDKSLPSPDSVKHVEEVLNSDDSILRAQGHVSELDRSFSWIGAIGLSYSIVNTWLTYACSFGMVLAYGGGQTTVFGLLVAALVQWIVLLGLAELCSAFPSSGGQYHFTYIVAPKRTKNFAAYMVGILNIVAWWVTTASGTIFTAISAFGIAKFWYPEFSGEQWQVYLCYILVIILTLVPIFTIPQKHIDYLTKTCMYLSFIGLFIVMIVCLVMGRGNYHPSNITEYRESSGWGPGPAWLMSIGLGEYGFAGISACTHIAEELPHPGRKLPQVINMTVLIGVVTAVPWAVAMVAVIQDIEAVQKAFLPSLEVFYQATGSKPVATFLQAYLTLLYYSCVPSQWITSSRIAWAFSRDNGLPFSDYWKHIDPTRKIPLRTTLLSAAFCVIYGLLYIASTAAFNSIVNTAILMLNITYTVPQGILATCGRDRLPRRPFNLGPVVGYAVNVFSIIWLIISGVVFCFPVSLPTTMADMNYNAIVISGIFAIILILWIERRKKFQGPAIDWEALNASNAMR
ncbi:amino acid transporter [Aspergillus steynii IBT 23096]|uniref:Amino acid transporter n=1 Tax=Aspergillus steynii IBT 23096 TaxID=1392250 RepID=A0A2I2G9Z1_9EURO|nr:amino acid transporter [Aspergillus steynii IBT 23096]PLB49685.1 amino acid transporter [Aspergillus steynii IBT 23096]